MKKTITAYHVGAGEIKIQRAPHTREWMDATASKYAYRCLPLVAANCYGWEMLCPATFSATWNGDYGLAAIDIVPKVDFAVSHFGYGILTFHIPYLFRTNKEADLLVSGPTNRYHQDCLPLEGIVETSWSPMTFTMNWRLIRPGIAVTFDRDEPFCRIVPIARNFLEGFQAQIVAAADVPKDIRQEYDQWSQNRGHFLDKLRADDPEAARVGWQKTYYKNGKVVKLHDFLTT